MTTTVIYEDVDEGTASYDHLRVAVRATYRKNRDDSVVLETYIAP
jgi:hypothetical protein